MARSVVSQAREDVRVFQAVVAAGAPVTDAVMHGLWQWFLDVELMLPLPVMDLNERERTRYASEILAEIDRILALMEASPLPPQNPTEAAIYADRAGDVDKLWRELAGVYAPIVNRSVMVLTDEQREYAHERVIPAICDSSGIDEDEARERVRHDPSLRLMLRRSGIDPDRIS